LDGNYLDRSTRQLTAEVVTYNAGLRVLGYTRATFDWQPDGAIKGKKLLIGVVPLYADMSATRNCHYGMQFVDDIRVCCQPLHTVPILLLYTDPRFAAMLCPPCRAH
jgi:hypothetical protein